MTTQVAALPARARARTEELLPPARPLRVVVFAKRKAHTRVTMHFIRGFQSQGHRVLWLRPSRLSRLIGSRAVAAWVLRRVARFAPDLVFVYKHDVAPELLERLPRDLPIVVFYEDAPRQPDERVVAVARQAGLLFPTAGGPVAELEAAGVPRARFLRSGCDPVDHLPGRVRESLRADAAFIGSAAGEDRLRLIRDVAARCSLRVYGSGWERAVGARLTLAEVYPEQYRDICASTRIVLGIDPRSDVSCYFSNRTWLTLGCGGFLLTRYVPGLEEFFTNHEHLVWFESHEQALELVDHYLARDDERERIARSGCEYVHAYHTFRHATAEIVGTVFEQPWHRAG